MVPNSFIKSVVIEIANDYALDSSPHSYESNKLKKIKFLDRKEEIAKFLELLKSASQKSFFLVTGFRGMGKTSFVNHVLRKNEVINPKVTPIHITLSQNQPKEIDILRLMVSTVFDKFKTSRKKDFLSKIAPYLRTALEYLLFFVFFMTMLMCIVSITSKTPLLFSTYNFGITFCILAVLYTILKVWHRYERSEDNAYNRLQTLVRRCYATLSEEKGLSDELSMATGGLALKFFGKTEKVLPPLQLRP